MLTGEIRIHEEPVSYIYGNNYTVQKTYKLMTPAEKAEFEIKVDQALVKAREVFKEGEIYSLKSGNRDVIITNFIDQPEEVLWYQGELCVIHARDPRYPAVQPIRYSMGEFDLTNVKSIKELENGSKVSE